MKLGVIGCGKMASALVEGVLKAGAFTKKNIVVSDKVPAAVKALTGKTGVSAVASNTDVAAKADVVLLCVKPNDAFDALEAAQEKLAGKLIISILAGVTIARLQKAAGDKARIVRVMPNTPALVHKGAAAYAVGHSATADDAVIVEKIFSSVGTVSRVKEELLDVVTGLSGSGPAYIYVVIEALADAGVLMGLSRDLALQLAAQTVSGAAEMALRTGLHPAQLKDQVTSPGGTTIAGLEALEAAGLRSAFLGAVRAATERSRELGKQS
ncbi:MAG TPA: pyrroline-5-carboxylate reductase [Chthoniobacteraceae bacterium]|nr:pyrroline-5-carboxylate reductase [Chthoniobacteraceae bacterium]